MNKKHATATQESHTQTHTKGTVAIWTLVQHSKWLLLLRLRISFARFYHHSQRLALFVHRLFCSLTHSALWISPCSTLFYICMWCFWTWWWCCWNATQITHLYIVRNQICRLRSDLNTNYLYGQWDVQEWQWHCCTAAVAFVVVVVASFHLSISSSMSPDHSSIWFFLLFC